MLKIKNKFKGLILPNCQSYYKLIVQCWYKDRQIDQLNRVENPEIDPNKYA